MTQQTWLFPKVQPQELQYKSHCLFHEGGNKMRVLVTGGAGYIGSVVVEQLCNHHETVVVYDNLSKGHREMVHPNATFIKGDILATDELAQLLSQYHIDAVVHMAADSLVGESVVDPAKYYHNNVTGSLSLLQAMQRAQVRSLVFSSTAAVYGEPAEQPITEQVVTSPTNPYGATKLAIEQALAWYAAAYDLRYVSLRYFNAAGATERVGELHDPETHLIPIVLQAALGIRPHVTVFGSDYNTDDGSCVRDYIHVIDLADAHIRSLEALHSGVIQQRIFNLGVGAGGHSVKQVIHMAQQVTQREIKVVYGDRRAGDPAVLIASHALIAQELGWRPTRDLRSMIQSAWQFLKGY